MRLKLKFLQKLLISSVAATFTIPVLAQDTLKITVTGTRNPRPVDTFPGSIGVLDKDDLSTKTGTRKDVATDEIRSF